MLYIQLIGILAFCIHVLSLYKKKRKEMLLFLLTSNIIYVLHYLLLGALTGAYVCTISIIRNIILLKFKGNKKILCAVFFTIYAIIGYIFYEGLYSLLPIIANSIYLVYLVSGERKKMLIGQAIGSSIWVIYGVFVLSYADIITETILALSSIIQLLKGINNNYDEEIKGF